jgi:hypothetical protein
MPDISPIFYGFFAGLGGVAGILIAAVMLAFGANPWAALAAVPVSAGLAYGFARWADR